MGEYMGERQTSMAALKLGSSIWHLDLSAGQSGHLEESSVST